MLDIKELIQQLPNLRTTVDAHSLMAKKALGQNFLLDCNVTNKIVTETLRMQKLSSFEGASVFEVGPGPGGLTRSVLCANPDKLTVIEMDDRCIAIMNEIKDRVRDKLEIINGDALKIDIAQLDGEPKHIIANLPYNISVPLLISWLKDIKNYASLTLMFQKEVGDRIMAPTNCKDYGRLSIIAQLNCSIVNLMDLNPNCFVPAPKIWSSVLLFRPKEKLLTMDQISRIEKLSTMAFGQRRKMIRQSLKSIPDLEAKCKEVGIETTWRPEQISPQKFLELSEII